MDDENENQLDTNPYASNNPKAVSADLAYKAGSFWSVPLLGALWSVVSAFPIAGMIALLFRFPVPLSGYMSGASAVIPAMIGVAVYGILLGGFVLVAALGALGATLATKLLPQHSKRWDHRDSLRGHYDRILVSPFGSRLVNWLVVSRSRSIFFVVVEKETIGP